MLAAQAGCAQAQIASALAAFYGLLFSAQGLPLTLCDQIADAELRAFAKGACIKSVSPRARLSLASAVTALGLQLYVLLLAPVLVLCPTSGFWGPPIRRSTRQSRTPRAATPTPTPSYCTRPTRSRPSSISRPSEGGRPLVLSANAVCCTVARQIAGCVIRQF